MFSPNPNTDHRAPCFRGYEFRLPERAPHSGRDVEFDYIAHGGYRDVSSSQTCHHDCPTNISGQKFGWGREGPVRLEPPRYLREGVDPRPFRGPGASAEPPIGYSFVSRLQPIRQRLDLPGDTLVYRRPCSMPRHRSGDIRCADCYCCRAVPDGFHISDFGSGSSLDPASQCSLHHLDRFSRPSHYQPPYAEEYASEIEQGPSMNHGDLLETPRRIPRNPNFTTNRGREKGIRPR